MPGSPALHPSPLTPRVANFLVPPFLPELPRILQRALRRSRPHLSLRHPRQRRLGTGPQVDQNLSRPHSDNSCWFDYYGNPTVDLSYYGIHCKPLLGGFAQLLGVGGAPIPSTISGTILVSSTEIDGLLWGPDKLDPYQIFQDHAPDATIGNIIFVFRGPSTSRFSRPNRTPQPPPFFYVRAASPTRCHSHKPQPSRPRGCRR